MNKLKDKKKGQKKRTEGKIYCGIVNLPKKQQPAVDELRSFLLKLAKAGNLTVVDLHGGYFPIEGKKKKNLGVYRLYEVTFFTPHPDKLGAGGGTSFMRYDGEAGGLLTACEGFLETFFVKPSKAERPEDTIDDHQDARQRLQYVWNLPSADSQRKVMAYLLWRERTHPHEYLTETMSSRVTGFYGDVLRKQLTDYTSGLNEGSFNEELEERFAEAEKKQPDRVLELRFKNDMVKHIVASKEAIQAWLALHQGLNDQLTNIYDLAQALESKGEFVAAEELLRNASGQDIDLYIGYEPMAALKVGERHQRPAIFHFTNRDMVGSSDPADEWLEQVKPSKAGEGA